MEKTAEEVVFVLATGEIRCAKSLLTSTSQYFQDLLQTADNYSEVRITLPDWVTPQPLETYFEFLSSQQIPKVDLLTAQKLLWLADLFSCPDLQKEAIDSVIIPLLSRDTVVYFLNDTYTRLKTQTGPSHWQVLFRACIGQAVKHALYIFDKFKDAVQTFDPQLVEQLGRLFLIENARKPISDYSPVLEVLREARKIPGFVSFLLHEHRQIINDPRWKESAEEVFHWSVQLSSHPEESPVFEYIGCHWTLSLSSQSDTLEVALRNVSADQPLHWPKHSIICVSVATEVNSTETLTPVIISTIAGTKTHNIIECKGVPDVKDKEVTIQLYARTEPLYSALLTHIARFPSSTLARESLAGFPIDKLLVLLKYKFLSVRNEDEVLEFVAKWCSSQFPSALLAEKHIEPVLASIKWDFVSLRGLLKTSVFNSTLKRTNSFQSIFSREMESRALIKFVHSSQEPDSATDGRPRFSYKHEVTKEVFQTQKSMLDHASETLFGLNYSPVVSSVRVT